MPIAYNENLMLADCDGGQRPRGDGEIGETPSDGETAERIDDGVTNKPLPVASDNPDVGLAQKGTDEDAIVRRETEI
jgi:hypothetical protein